MLKKLLFLFAFAFSLNAGAQTIDELKAERDTKAAALAELQSQAAALKGEVSALSTEITNLSGWQIGALGTVGANFSSFSNWFGAANPDVFTSVIGVTGTGYANLQDAKYFWRNNLNAVATKTKLVFDDASRDSLGYETTADAINLTSLFGYKLTDKFAISSLGEYRSTILDNFNNPGFFDIGVGATWTPIPNAVVVIHPLNYNLVFADEDFSYESSVGCKVVADYGQSLPMGIAWKTNLSAFISYNDVPNYSNWTWVNGLSATVWKGLGVGFDFGLRSNKQEAYNTYLTANSLAADAFPIDDLEGDDNPLQTYWVLGLSYKISK